MGRPVLRTVLLLALLLTAPSTPGGCSPPTDPLVVLAASSLAELARELADDHQARWSRPVEVRLASSATLARQLQQGLAADLFLSASDRWAEAVEGVDRRPWLGNRLAWVVRRDGPHPGPGAAASLVLAAPDVPVGRYADEVLAAEGWALPARVVRGNNARDTLRKLVAGAAEAAVVYVTDAAAEPDVESLAVLPATGPPPARYVAVLLRERGRPLFEELFSDAARRRASELGYEPPP